MQPTPSRAKCFEGNLGWLLYRAHWALASEMTAALAPLGLSGRGYHVLRAALDGEHTQKELADMVGLDKTTMVVTIDELEQDASRSGGPRRRQSRPRDLGHQGRQAQLTEANAVKEQVQSDVVETLAGEPAQGAAGSADRPGRGPAVGAGGLLRVAPPRAPQLAPPTLGSLTDGPFHGAG